MIAEAITWNPGGMVTNIAFGASGTQDYSADDDLSYRLERQLDTAGATTLRDTSYAYSSRDDLIIVTDQLNLAGDQLHDEDFLYNPRQMLSQAIGDYGTLTYAYDAVGNRTGHTLDDGSLVSYGYSYGATTNRLDTVAETPGPPLPRTLTTDAAGNVIQDDRAGGDYSYTYNHAGRLSAVHTVGGQLLASYFYNARGQQVRRLVGSQEFHTLYYPNGNRFAEYEIVGGAPELLRMYVWLGLTPIAVIEHEAATGIDAIYYVRADHIGRSIWSARA